MLFKHNFAVEMRKQHGTHVKIYALRVIDLIRLESR